MLQVANIVLLVSAVCSSIRVSWQVNIVAINAALALLLDAHWPYPDRGSKVKFIWLTGMLRQQL